MQRATGADTEWLVGTPRRDYALSLCVGSSLASLRRRQLGSKSGIEQVLGNSNGSAGGGGRMGSLQRVGDRHARVPVLSGRVTAAVVAAGVLGGCSATADQPMTHSAVAGTWPTPLGLIDQGVRDEQRVLVVRTLLPGKDACDDQ